MKEPRTTIEPLLSGDPLDWVGRKWVARCECGYEGTPRPHPLDCGQDHISHEPSCPLR